MGKLSVFNFVSLDGYYKDQTNNIGWHKHSPKGSDENEFAEQGAQSESILLFGRVTYEMMSGYWPSAMAKQNDPVMAEGMNKAEKIVFSKTLKKAEWNNTKVATNLLEEVMKIKMSSSKDITILGSGSIVTQLADAGLIDEYQLMIDPVAIGGGTSIFKGLENPLELKLVESKVFKSGVVLLKYKK
jgi:dihydrofolate reductase